jgi:drug/metabolite transporter (DMT)-like permease
MRAVSESVKWKVLLVVTMVGLASVFPASKAIVARVSPLLLSFFRYFIALVCILPFFFRELRTRKISFTKRDIGSMSLLSVIGIAGFACFLFYGIHLSTAVNGSILANTQPIFAVLLAPLLIGELFQKSSLIGAAVGIIGIVLVVTGGNLGIIEVGGTSILGNVLLVCAAVSMALFSIFLRQYVQKYGSIITTVITFAIGTVILFVVALMAGGALENLTKFGIKDIFLLIYIGIGGTAITYLLFNKALTIVPVSVAVGYKFLIPVFGALLSVLFLGERPNGITLLGMAVVIGSLIFIQWEEKKT